MEGIDSETVVETILRKVSPRRGPQGTLVRVENWIGMSCNRES